MVVNEDGERIFEGEKATIYAGGSQPDKRSMTLTGKTPLSVETKLGGIRW